MVFQQWPHCAEGEIDWWEAPSSDQVAALARDRDITVVSQYATAVGILRFNHLHPPFNNVAVRQALLGAVDQAEAMTAVAGTERTLWHDGIGLFPTGTPFANDAGIEVVRGPRDYAAVRHALARAGYNGEKIVVVAPTDAQPIHALSLAGTDQLRRAGMNVDLQATQEGPSTSTECFLWRRSRAQCEPRQTLGCCRANFIKRHSTLPASLPTSSGARVSPPFRAVEFSNCAPNLAATGPRVHNPEIAHRLLDELT